MLSRALAIILILALSSCLNNKDYTLDSLTVTPSIAFPLAFGDISVLDLVSNKDSTYLKVYPDGLLYFSYSQTLPSQDIRSLFTIPNNAPAPTKFPLASGTYPATTVDSPTVTISQTLDLTLTPEQLSEVLLKAGTLSYTIGFTPQTNPANGLPFDLLVTFTDIINKTTLAPLVFNVSTVGTGSKPLQNYIINLNKNKFAVKLDMVLKKRTNSVFVSPNTTLNVQLAFTGMDFTYIKGFLGDQTAILPAQTIDLSVFSSSLKKSKISFVQPVIKMDVRNDYGVPCEVNFQKLEARKTGATLPILTSPANPVALNFPTSFGTSANTTLNITNAVQVLDFSPTQLAYSATARINKGLSSGANFLSDTSKLKVTMTADVPLYGQASGITLADTLKVDLGSISQSSVITSSLKIKTTNQLPLDANIQLYLLDKNYVVLDSIFTSNQTYLVKASSVTTAGDLLTAGTSDLKLDLSTDKINKLFSSSYILVRSKLNTTKDANGTLLNVKFKTAYKLKINVGLLAKMSIKS